MDSNRGFDECGEWYVLCKRIDNDNRPENDEFSKIRKTLKPGLNTINEGIAFISKGQLSNYTMYEDSDDMYIARVNVTADAMTAFPIQNCLKVSTQLTIDEPQKFDRTFVAQHISPTGMDFNFNAGQPLSMRDWMVMTNYYHYIEA